MTNNRLSRCAAGADMLQEQRKKTSKFIAFAAVACTILAALGDWKVLNNAYGGLPKAIALGTIVCAFLQFLVAADFIKLKKAVGFFPIFLLLIAVYVLISMYIWITDFSQTSSISRAGQKILYQTITIVYAVFMCYLFEEKAVHYLFFSMCAANTSIMLLEMPKYGFVESITSVVKCIVTFGEAEGFVRALEIHDITFLFGQFFIYYMMFAPNGTKAEKRLKWCCVLLSAFFLLVGLKRSTLPAVLLVCLYVLLLRRMRTPRKLILATGIGLFLFFYLYLYLTRSGILVSFLESLGIDMMGRDVLWSLPNDYYTLSPLWKGLGFEGSACTIETPEGTFTARIPVPGIHNCSNAAAATAVGLSFGMTLEEIRKGIESAQTISGRFRIRKTEDKTVIDDCYNANPVSMKSSLMVLSQAQGRRCAVLGDMGELGEEEDLLHEKTGSRESSRFQNK